MSRRFHGGSKSWILLRMMRKENTRLFIRREVVTNSALRREGAAVKFPARNHQLSAKS